MAEIGNTDHAAERLLLGGEPRYAQREAAARAGVSEERAVSLWRSLGFATPGEADVVFTDADLDALRTVTALHDAGLGGAAAEMALSRATGQAMARLAEWQVSILRDQMTLAGTDRQAVTDRQAGTEDGFTRIARLLPEIERLLRYVWHRHLLAEAQRLLPTPSSPGETTTLAVGFADIAGYTNLSRGLDETHLADFLEEFEAGTWAVVAEHNARVVKTVGDEIMFVADTPDSASEIGLILADRLSSLDGQPELHVGIAYGPVLRRLGDVYGTVVNLASRLTSLARPGAVLVDRGLAEAIADRPDYRVRKLRRVTVRGFPHLQPWLLQRRAAPDHAHR